MVFAPTWKPKNQTERKKEGRKKEEKKKSLRLAQLSPSLIFLLPERV
jgi:hypothetical protein